MDNEKKATATLEPEAIEMGGLSIAEETEALAVSGQQEILEADFKVIDVAVTEQIVQGLRGHFLPELCYNIPRRTPTGQFEWPECDLMPNGFCKYREGKDKAKHIHIVGIGYHGAAEALQVVPGMTADVVEPPTIVEEGGRLFWRCKAICMDQRTGSSITRYAFKPVMEMRKSGIIESEHAMLVVQSLSIRNVILAMVPFAMKQAWINEYREGKKKFRKTVPRKKLPAKTEKQLPKAKTEKPKPEPRQMSASALKELQAAVDQASRESKIDADLLMQFALDPTQFKTVAQAMVLLVGSCRDDSKLNTLKTRFKHWSDMRAVEEAENEAAQAQAEGKEQPAGEPGQQNLC
jgi:hypothetical protein